MTFRTHALVAVVGTVVALVRLEPGPAALAILCFLVSVVAGLVIDRHSPAQRRGALLHPKAAPRLYALAAVGGASIIAGFVAVVGLLAATVLLTLAAVVLIGLTLRDLEAA